MEILTIKNITLYLLIINVFTFLCMGIDKWKAKKNKFRIKESTLITLVFLGGGFGGIAGMYVFRHKTKKPRFYIGFPTILIFEIIITIVYIMVK